jgi:hypothetical protein
MTWNLPLVVTAGVFVLFLLYRLRPVLPGSRRGGVGVALREARKRIETAPDEKARALALADAGDACARSVGRTTGAVGYYLRAMRLDPASATLVERAGQALVRRPHALESLLWRRLGAEAWTGDREAAARAALAQLVRLYDGPLKNRVRARAIDNALAAMPAPPASPPQA